MKPLELMAERRIRLRSREERMIHGGQGVEIGKGEWIEVELDVVVPEGDGAVELRHMFRNGPHTLLEKKQRLTGGHRYRLKYSFAPPTVARKGRRP